LLLQDPGAAHRCLIFEIHPGHLSNPFFEKNQKTTSFSLKVVIIINPLQIMIIGQFSNKRL